MDNFNWDHPDQPMWDAVAHAHLFLQGKSFTLPDGETLGTLYARHKAEQTDWILKGVHPDEDYFNYAEWMLNAQAMLEYNKLPELAQGKWPGTQPFDDKTMAALTKGAQKLMIVISWGYRDGEWWNLTKIWPVMQERIEAVAAIIDLCRLTEYLISRGWPSVSSYEAAIPMLVSGLNIPRAYKMTEKPIDTVTLMSELMAHWDPKFRREVLRRRKEAEGAELHPCVNPFCTRGEDGQPTLVSANKTYCCPACRSYKCSHPECIQKAEQNGWPYMSHSWDTSRGREHQAYRIIGD